MQPKLRKVLFSNDNSPPKNKQTPKKKSKPKTTTTKTSFKCETHSVRTQN